MGGELHQEVLPETQQSVLAHLASVVREAGFYLAGGTALAIQVGHLRSLDLHWFRGPSFDAMTLVRRLSASVELTVESTAEETLHATVSGVQVSFLAYAYPLLQPLVEWTAFDCQLASLDDIAAMKLAALSGRGARKDFVDLDALLDHGYEIDRLLDLFAAKFGFRNTAHILASLLYFDDAEHQPMPEMLRPRSWEQIRANIERAVEAYVS